MAFGAGRRAEKAGDYPLIRSRQHQLAATVVPVPVGAAPAYVGFGSKELVFLAAATAHQGQRHGVHHLKGDGVSRQFPGCLLGQRGQGPGQFADAAVAGALSGQAGEIAAPALGGVTEESPFRRATPLGTKGQGQHFSVREPGLGAAANRQKRDDIGLIKVVHDVIQCHWESVQVHGC